MGIFSAGAETLRNVKLVFSLHEERAFPRASTSCRLLLTPPGLSGEGAGLAPRAQLVFFFRDCGD